MKRTISNAFIIILVLTLVACAADPHRTSNQYMTISDPKQAYYPKQGKALLIIERVIETGMSVYNMPVWDVTDRTKPVLIGYISPSMKAAYDMAPGEHTILMQLAASNTMMKLTVDANKTYFTKVGTTGWPTAHFFPIKKGKKNDMTRDNISVATKELIAWGKDKERIEGSLQTRIDKAMSKWNDLDDDYRETHNMVAEDGR